MDSKKRFQPLTLQLQEQRFQKSSNDGEKIERDPNLRLVNTSRLGSRD